MATDPEPDPLDESMREMAADPAIQAAIAEINAEFTITETDGFQAAIAEIHAESAAKDAAAYQAAFEQFKTIKPSAQISAAQRYTREEAHDRHHRPTDRSSEPRP